MQNRGRELLDRFAGGIEVGDALLAHQRFCPAYLVIAICERRVVLAEAAVVADVLETLLADLLQPLGAYGEPVDAAAEGLYLRRQLHGREVIRRKRIIGGADPELHGEIE